MLPKNIINKINLLPKKSTDRAVKNIIKQFRDSGYDEEFINLLLLSQEDRKKVLKKLGILPKSAFFELYKNTFELPISLPTNELLSLEQILEYYNDPSFWWDDIDDNIKKQYPDAPKRYLQISTQEGEGGLFYDTKTDAVYDVDWGEEEDMITGKLKPIFNSFYDFLEWYYSEDEES